MNHVAILTISTTVLTLALILLLAIANKNGNSENKKVKDDISKIKAQINGSKK